MVWRSDLRLISLALMRVDWKLARPRVDKMAKIAMAISSSMRVKPDFAFIDISLSMASLTNDVKFALIEVCEILYCKVK